MMTDKDDVITQATEAEVLNSKPTFDQVASLIGSHPLHRLLYRKDFGAMVNYFK
jgi:hypothetical protein